MTTAGTPASSVGDLRCVAPPAELADLQERRPPRPRRRSSWETIRRFEIFEADLTVETGDLTPSLKTERRVVEDENRTISGGFDKE